MERLNVNWMVPARDGNTCYRPPVGTASLRECFEDELGSIDGSFELRFEETLMTSADETGGPQLMIGERSLREWSRDLGNKYRNYWETTVKPALRNHNFDPLRRHDFLEDVLRFVLESDEEPND